MALANITVVVPAFRAVLTLRRTLESCLREIDPLNVIVVLDGPDGPLEQVARSIDGGVQVAVLDKNSGAPVCRNTGLALVQTDHVMFLDADDYVEGGLLASALVAAQSPAADLVFGPFCLETPGGERQMHAPDTLYRPFDHETVLRSWLVGAYTPPCAIVWRTDFVRRIGGWDEALAKNQDGDIVFRALMANARLAVSRDGLGVYVQDENPHRISRRHNRVTLESQLAVLEKIRNRLGSLSFDPARELSLSYYNLARLAFTVGEPDVGARAEAAARVLGLAGQPGSLPHTVLSSVLGLQGKQRLASIIKQRIGL